MATIVRDVSLDETETFREQGWVYLREFISEDFAGQLLEESQRLMGPDGTLHTPRRGIDIDFNWWPEYQLPGFQGLEPFRTLAFDASIGRAAHALAIRRPVGVRYMRDQIACRLPKGSAKDSPAPPHQDFSSAVFDRVGYINFWIALNDIPPERGSLRFYNRSHREGPLGWRDKSGNLGPSGRSILEVYPDFAERCPRSAPLHLRPGDATAHHILTVHEAPQNLTDTPRWTCINLYFPEDAIYTGNTYGGVEPVVPVGKTFDHPRFPVVWRPNELQAS